MAKKTVRTAYLYIGLVSLVLVIAAVAPGKGFMRSKVDRVAPPGARTAPQSEPISAVAAPATLAVTSPAAVTFPRVVRILSGSVLQGQNVVVVVNFDSQGNENAFGFSVTYDSTKLTYVPGSAVNGSDAVGASLVVNAQSGKVGIGQALSPGSSFTTGTREILRLTFTAAANFAGTTNVTIGDSPVPHECVAADASDLTPTTDWFNNPGTITINNLAPTLANISPTGEPPRRATTVRPTPTTARCWWASTVPTRAAPHWSGPSSTPASGVPCCGCSWRGRTSTSPATTS